MSQLSPSRRQLLTKSIVLDVCVSCGNLDDIDLGSIDHLTLQQALLTLNCTMEKISRVLAATDPESNARLSS